MGEVRIAMLTILFSEALWFPKKKELSMDKEDKWEKIIEFEDFIIEKKGNTIRALDSNGSIINSIEYIANLKEKKIIKNQV
jgi:hypothetical protein